MLLKYRLSWSFDPLIDIHAGRAGARGDRSCRAWYQRLPILIRQRWSQIRSQPFHRYSKSRYKRKESSDMLTLKILPADQYTESIPRIRIRKNGGRVVADRGLTISYIYNAYYWYA